MCIYLPSYPITFLHRHSAGTHPLEHPLVDLLKLHEHLDIMCTSSLRHALTNTTLELLFHKVDGFQKSSLVLEEYWWHFAPLHPLLQWPSFLWRSLSWLTKPPTSPWRGIELYDKWESVSDMLWRGRYPGWLATFQYSNDEVHRFSHLGILCFNVWLCILGWNPAS